MPAARRRSVSCVVRRVQFAYGVLRSAAHASLCPTNRFTLLRVRSAEHNSIAASFLREIERCVGVTL